MTSTLIGFPVRTHTDTGYYIKLKYLIKKKQYAPLDFWVNFLLIIKGNEHLTLNTRILHVENKEIKRDPQQCTTTNPVNTFLTGQAR